MGLDKSIISGKEKRKQYRKSKSVSCSCRNHGGCPYCEGNRLNKEREKERLSKQEINDLI